MSSENDNSSNNRHKTGRLFGYHLKENPHGKDGHSTAIQLLALGITITVALAAVNFGAIVEEKVVTEKGEVLETKPQKKRRSPGTSLFMYWLLIAGNISAVAWKLNTKKPNLHGSGEDKHYFNSTTVFSLRCTLGAILMIAFLSTCLVLLGVSPGQVEVKQLKPIATLYTFKTDGSKGIRILCRYTLRDQNIENEKSDGMHTFLIHFDQAPDFRKNWQMEISDVYAGTIDLNTTENTKKKRKISRALHGLVQDKKATRYVGIRLDGFRVGQILTFEFRFSPTEEGTMKPKTAVKLLRSKDDVFKLRNPKK